MNLAGVFWSSKWRQAFEGSGYLGYYKPFNWCNWRIAEPTATAKNLPSASTVKATPTMEPADLVPRITLKHPKGAHSGRNDVGFVSFFCFHNSRQLSKQLSTFTKTHLRRFVARLIWTKFGFHQYLSERSSRVIIWVRKISNSRVFHPAGLEF